MKTVYYIMEKKSGRIVFMSFRHDLQQAVLQCLRDNSNLNYEGWETEISE